MLLSSEDRAAIERLVLDRTLAPSFEILKSCLIWEDEVPRGISGAGYKYVQDLWATRGWIHRGVPLERWTFGHERFLRIWDDALSSGLKWPGFHRLALSTGDQQYLREQLADEDGIEGFLIG